MKSRVILVASKTGYQVREFHGAAERLGVELVLATDRCHVLEDPWGDAATPVQFDQIDAGIDALSDRGPFDGIVAVGDKPAAPAAEIARRLRLPFHPPDAVRAANDKFLTRELFCRVGLNVPAYALVRSGADPLVRGRRPRRPAGEDEKAESTSASSCGSTAGPGVRRGPGSGPMRPPYNFPSVLKPLHLSASRGVIRANGPREFAEALARIRRIAGEQSPVLVEDFIPGREFALEGVVTGGKLQTLALFDKPDPLDGPFFEETIYVTPSRESAELREAIEVTTQRAVTALGLTHGSVHAEMRVNSDGVWMLEAAARPIGGLCARVLRFQPDLTLEELLLRHAVGQDVSTARLMPGGHGVMMIPIPGAGVYRGVDGVEQAAQTADIEAVEITAKEGQYLEPLPEGASYLGFLFSRSATPEGAERSLRKAHSLLRFHMSQSLPVVR